MLLPRTLLCLMQAWLVLADTRLALNQLQTISATASPLTYALPSSANPVSVSVALCSYPRSTPRFFVSNGSITTPGPDNLGQQDVFEIDVSEYSLGNVTVQVASTGVLSVYNATGMSFEVGVSDEGECLHACFSVSLSIRCSGIRPDCSIFAYSPFLCTETVECCDCSRAQMRGIESVSQCHATLCRCRTDHAIRQDLYIKS